MRRKLLLALAAAAVTVAVVLAASSGVGGHHHRRKSDVPAGQSAQRVAARGDIAVGALYLGLTRAQLRRRLRTGTTLGEVADATPGHSAHGLEQALLAAREAQWRAQGASAAEVAARARKLRGRIRRGVIQRSRAVGDVAVAARYLGLPEARLREEVLRGRSMASLANAKAGRSREGLIAAIVAYRTSRIGQALAAHVLTAQQARSAQALLPRRAAREVDRVPAKG